MSWSNQQESAIQAVRQWLKDPSAPQIFHLFGYAGTGKSTIAKELASSVKGAVMFMAYTGKAALVMRSKGCTGACTIHSAIYRLEEDGPQPEFVLNKDSNVGTAKLVIVDEVSMVDDVLGRDLLSFGTKVLVLGDPFQLPPVKGTGFFMTPSPEVMLTDIHRQAADNPIIRLSMDIREGRGLDIGDYGDTRVITRDQLQTNEVVEVDQVLVGVNRTRRGYNQRLRQLQGVKDRYPVIGDKLVCLRNNKELNLLNGGLGEVMEVSDMDRHRLIKMDIAPIENTREKPTEVHVPAEFFEGTEDQLPWQLRRQTQEFDYGYALTVHKSQGSQWDNVMLFDESRTFRQDADRWLYTGVTRAAERLTVVV